MIASSIWNLKFCLAPSVVHILVQQWHLKKKKNNNSPMICSCDTYRMLSKEAACLSVSIISVELLLTVSTASSHYLRPVFWWRETVFNTLFSTDVMPMSVASLCIQHKEYIKYALNMANGKCTTRIICDIIFVFFFFIMFCMWTIASDSSNSEIVCLLRVRSLLCLLSWFVWR